MTATEFKALLATLASKIASRPAVPAVPARAAVPEKFAQTAKPARPASAAVPGSANTVGYAFGELYLNSPAYPAGTAIPAITAKPASAAVVAAAAIPAVAAVAAVPVQLPLVQFEREFEINTLDVKFCLPIVPSKFGADAITAADLVAFRGTDKSVESAVLAALPDVLVSNTTTKFKIVGGQTMMIKELVLIP